MHTKRTSSVLATFEAAFPTMSSGNTSTSSGAVGDKKRISETRNPMLDLCRNKNWRKAEEWLEEHSNHEIKEALENTDALGSLTALHFACYKGAPLSVVRSMIMSAPHIVTIAVEGGDLPLHYATEYEASIEVLRVLIEANQKTLTAKGSYGHTPLSRALQVGLYHKNVEAIRLLAGNGAVSIANDGLLPLHFAMMVGFSAKIIQSITAEFTNKNQKGQTPLLWAIEEGCLADPDEGYLIDSDAVEMLGSNGAAFIADKGGNFPLHTCCM